jgi:hypothetical protein
MNKPAPLRGILVCAFLVACLVAASGCATVGLDSKPSPTPTKIIPLPQVTSTASSVQTLQTLRTIAPATTSPVVIPVTTVVRETRYSVKTCAGLGGYVVSPGGSCTGQWLDATDTFSCCSAQPVSGATGNLSIKAVPLDLRVNVADDPGSIIP